MGKMSNRMITARAIATALVVATLVAAPARAADKLEAKERKARVECAAGDYAEGVRLLAELWVATGDATFLYNQGRCYEQSGQNDLAVSRFREYLRKAPALPAEDVEAVNRRIDELQRQAASRAAPAPTVINLVSPTVHKRIEGGDFRTLAMRQFSRLSAGSTPRSTISISQSRIMCCAQNHSKVMVPSALRVPQ